MTVSPFGVRGIRARRDLTTMKHRLRALEAEMAQERPAALEEAKADKEARGGLASGRPGHCGARDTFHLGTLKGVGRVHRQALIGTCAKAGFAKPHGRKAPITAADLPDDRVPPFHDEHDVPLLRILADRGTACCGTHDRHGHEACLAVESIDHGRTEARSPQANGIVERFHKTVLDELHRVAFRREIHATIEEPQADPDIWMAGYNQARSHQGRYCFGKAPMQTLIDATPAAREKAFAAQALAADAIA